MRNARARIRGIIGPRELLSFGVYAVVTAFMTYPAITLTGRIHGTGEAHGVLYNMWWYRYSFANHLPVARNIMKAFPFGAPASLFSADPLTNVLQIALSIATGATAAYNLYLIAAFILNAAAMYYLVRYLTRSRAASFFSGLILGFSPFVLMTSEEWLGMALVIWLPLFMLSLINAWKKRTTGSMVACAAVFVILTLFSYQYALQAALIFIVFVVSVWLTGKPWKRRIADLRQMLKTAIIALCVSTIVLTLFFFFTRTDKGREQANLHYLSGWAARPLDYILPHPQNPLLGRITPGLHLRTHRDPQYNRDRIRYNFLGYVPMLFVAYALVMILRRKEPPEKHTRADKNADIEGASHNEAGVLASQENRRIILSITACAAAAFIFSMPPVVRLPGVNIPNPSRVMIWLVPRFRVYARFGLTVIICVAVLAGYGMAEMLARGYFKRYRFALFVAICILILLEFTIVPPFISIDARNEEPYTKWLKRQPGDTVAAIYPLYHSIDSLEYLFQQRIHEKRLINGAGFAFDEAEKYRQVLLDLHHPATPGLLSRLGADYVLVLPEELRDAKNLVNYVFPHDAGCSVPEGLSIVDGSPDLQVLRVTAEKAKVVPLFRFCGEKGWALEAFRDGSGIFWHAALDLIIVDIESKYKTDKMCDISFYARSAEGECDLLIGHNGAESKTVRISEEPSSIVVEDIVLKPGRNTLALRCGGTPVETGRAEMNVTYYTGYLINFMVSNILVDVPSG